MSLTREELQLALSDRYDLEHELGAGGMAIVWLARDLKHDRRVAIKILRPELAAVVGGDRFLKEIRTIANLQHPHILQLHDSGEAAGLIYYVMPFVEGESLRDLLRRERQLAVDEAVRIGRQVAAGLDYAHRHGVVHRDIKPENILLHDGSALIADFGIALALSRTDGATRMTETGMSLGTPHYMSPEQAMGERDIGPRSDIYSLGCVLYEMLAGEPPFTGPSPQAIVARVMTEEPRSLVVQRRTIPHHVAAAVEKALSKLPADRFATAAAFGDALEDVRQLFPPARVAQAPAAQSRRTRSAALAAAAVVLLITGAVAGWLTPRQQADAPPAIVSIPVPPDVQLLSPDRGGLAISHDGITIAFGGVAERGQQFYARRLDDPIAVPIPGTEGGFEPGFSADGTRLFFVRGLQGFVLPASGGVASATPLAGERGWTALWDTDGSFVAVRASGAISRVRGGDVEELFQPDRGRGEGFLLPEMILPDGRILFIAQTQGLTGTLWIGDPKRRTRQMVTSDLVSSAGYHSGWIAWVTPTGALLASQWDDAKGQLVGSSRMLGNDVAVAPGVRPLIAFSPSGSLVYQPAGIPELVLVNRSGEMRPVGVPPRRYHSPRVSPDGRRIAVDVSAESRDVWVIDLRDSTLTRATFDRDGHDVHWMPDGRSLLYASARGRMIGARRISLDGGQVGDSVLYHGAQLSIHAVTQDGRWAYAVAAPDSGGFDIIRIDLERGTREPFVASEFIEGWPALAPDDRWLAYASNETGRDEVYVRSLAPGGRRIVVSNNGGVEPVWSRNGRELYYREPDSRRLIAASLVVEPELRVVSRTPLFDVSNFEAATPHANYDVTADAQFVFVSFPQASSLTYIQSWATLARRK